MNHLRIYLKIFVLTIVAAGCKQAERWDTATIDPNIRSAPVYAEMDKQAEISSFMEKNSSKKTSDVSYSDGNTADRYLKFNNCRANFYPKSQEDTLGINIGFWNGHAGNGFIIRYKNKRFHTEPYVESDLILEEKYNAIYKLEYQKLTLDKPDYKPGDSLYGKIDFTSIEKYPDKGKVHKGYGYFRAKVASINIE
jgi:hypothetical protein